MGYRPISQNLRVLLGRIFVSSVPRYLKTRYLKKLKSLKTLKPKNLKVLIKSLRFLPALDLIVVNFMPFFKDTSKSSAALAYNNSKGNICNGCNMPKTNF